jgi:hypothetical protein
MTRTSPTADRIYSADQMRARHRGHFFDADTMRSFGSRLLDTVIPAVGGGRTYFVTSERDRHAGTFRYSDGTISPGAWGGQRRYTVRVMTDATGDVDDPEGDGFGAYTSSASAIRAARKLAAADTIGAGPAPCAIASHVKYGGPNVTHRGRAYCAPCLDSAARMLAERRRPSDGPVPRTEARARLRGARAQDIEYARSDRRRARASA